MMGTALINRLAFQFGRSLSDTVKTQINKSNRMCFFR